MVNRLVPPGALAEFKRTAGVPERVIRVVQDPSHQAYYQIPVYDYAQLGGKFVSLFRPADNPKSEIKSRLLALVRSRRGYQVGDLFVTPWGHFLVTDTFGIKEV